MKNSWWLFVLIISSVLGAFTSADKGYKPGDQASDFKLKDVSGKEISLQDFSSAKGYILIFTCNHCPCAAKYEDRILALDKKYKPLGYPVIAVNSVNQEQYPTETFSRMKARASFKKYSFPYLKDEDQEVAIAYGAPSTPYVYVLQRSGDQLKVRYTGAIDDNIQDPKAVLERYVENAVDQLLAGKPVIQPVTLMHGCVLNIRRKG